MIATVLSGNVTEPRDSELGRPTKLQRGRRHRDHRLLVFLACPE